MDEDELDLDIYLDQDNIAYEEEIIKNPCNIKSWLRYINFQSDDETAMNSIYERAVKEIPGRNYLKALQKQCKQRKVTDEFYKTAISVHERSLIFMNKMPRIWIEYCTFLTQIGLISFTRRTFDRALRSLPITQHHRIWPLYIKFIQMHQIPETGKRAFRRYLKFNPYDSEDYIDYLISKNSVDEAASVFIKILNDETFVSKHDKTNYQLWYELCELVCKHPLQITSVNIDPIIRCGIKRFSNEKGKLWNSLADYYIRSGLFEKARDIYEEAILDVTTVRDFTQIFDAYSQFEESVITKLMDECSTRQLTEDEDLELEIRLARLENLMERRLLLLNSVLLRQNPHNIHEWLKRVKLYEGNHEKIVETFESALKTVNQPKLLVGRLSDLWIAYANYYEQQENTSDTENDQSATIQDKDDIEMKTDQFDEQKSEQNIENVDSQDTDSSEEDEIPDENIKRGITDANPGAQNLINARTIWERSVEDPNYAKIDHLAQVWCAWIEMEIKYENYALALKLLQRATTPNQNINTNYFDETDIVQNRLFKSLKIWSLYADLEESFGTFASTKAVYDRIIELRIATPQIILNYGLFLEENRYFEEAFKAYEKGVSLFKWPNVYDIWNTYLAKFVDRYGGTKLERARDLFEQCLEHCPPKFAKSIYLLYAKLEEDHGLARHAMAVYDRATNHLPALERYEMYLIYVQKCAAIFGLPKTRAIYQKAIESLPNHQSREMCLQFAELECKLGEIDRARAIYAHGSQMADPRTAAEYWQTWKDFEIKHGNEDTVREMLRIRRSVQAVYSTHLNFVAAQNQMVTKDPTTNAMAAMEQEIE